MIARGARISSGSRADRERIANGSRTDRERIANAGDDRELPDVLRLLRYGAVWSGMER